MEGTDKLATQRDLYLQLRKEFRLLHLVWHRNKNQHRVSVWWKRLSMMKRNCAQVVEILQKPAVEKTTDVVRLYKLVNDFNKRQVPKTYHDFNGVIGLGQFVTLGVVLVGLLSRVFSTYKQILSVFQVKFQDAGCLDKPVLLEAHASVAEVQTQSYLGLEEIGEEVVEEVTKTIQTTGETKTNVDIVPMLGKKASKKKKKKKSKSVIDSIFG